MYLVCVMFFAVLLYAVPDRCHLKIPSFRGAVLLSMEALSTLGFGIPDVYCVFAGA